MLVWARAFLNPYKGAAAIAKLEAERAGFDDLVGIDHEVLPQQGQPDRLARDRRHY